MKINRKSFLNVCILIVITIAIMMIMPNYSHADPLGLPQPTGQLPQTQTSNPIDNPDAYKPGEIDGNTAAAITGKARPIIGIITTVGIIVLVITLIVIGMKYMLGSVEDRAEYKKTMIFYIIGVVFIVCIIGIIRLIGNLVLPIVNSI